MEMETSSRNIFWGLVVKPGKRYETEVNVPWTPEKLPLTLKLWFYVFPAPNKQKGN